MNTTTLSLCQHCFCASKTIRGICGKCQEPKDVNKTTTSVDIGNGDVNQTWYRLPTNHKELFIMFNEVRVEERTKWSKEMNRAIDTMQSLDDLRAVVQKALSKGKV